MESYTATYMHSINPIPDQELWERFGYNKPRAPQIIRKPGPLKTNRRKDVDEEPSGSKKPKNTCHLKRKYKEFTCAYCGARGHTKRSCKHRKADDAAVAEATTSAAVTSLDKDFLNEAITATITFNHNNLLPQVPQPNPTPPPPPPPSQSTTHATRPDKLPLKRKVPPVDPMQGASVGTTSRLQAFYKMIPTPSFRPPRKTKD
ncbi:hypothetical protein PIB30_078378 [Stylosanthes scabra]|uniref:CCHC-type domain-containing protein n=1 Tax=Stylosanthes scabra TaxID=79078 RepID=A0ABU6RR94_9FABA|nr:hypothetical protein [Stylosanthes scabra]